MNTDTLKEIFQSPFNYPKYSRIIVHGLFGCNDVYETIDRAEHLDPTPDGDQNYFLGQMEDAERQLLGFFYTRVAEGSDVRRKRVGLRKLIQPYLRYEVEAAIAVFDDGQHWRLSYICDHKEGTTSAKRFSYVLGDKQGQYKTPLERLNKIASKYGRFKLEDLKDAFSVDALSKEFFDEYHRHYDRILRTTVELISKDPTLYSGLSKLFADYIKKMMGRIVFLHFLQKKGWLNGDPEFLKNLFSKQPPDRREDFLEQVLEPLFFGIFNTEPQNREKLFRDEGWDVQLLEQWKGLPYLNGGLFERDMIDNAKMKLPASLFEQLFGFMSSYNFTVDENDPDDADIGIDPEMLGKIFESLLEDNKAKGAFYTPKEIVRYMCKESLIAYLDSKIETDNASEKQNAQSANNPIQESKQLSQCGGADTKDQCVPEVRDLKQSIRDFVETHEFSTELDPYRTTLDTALREVKICDPAIGSGAFPMGLLNELWRCREALSTASESQVTVHRSQLKKQIIENNIYGVDIEQGAIDIARLRFWLSIVVDAEWNVNPDSGPEPLPNFDYKFMQGNSLIESFDGHDLSHIMESGSRPLPGRGARRAGWVENQTGMDFSSDDTRQNLRIWLKKFFSLTDHKEKAHYRKLINNSVKNYIVQQGIGPAAETRLNIIDPSANKDFFLWHTWFKDIFDNGGFDIVIGNPPYGAKLSQEHKRLFKSLYNSAKTIKGKQKGSLDTYVLFLELGFNILANNGQLAFIVPMPITSNDSVSGLHNILLSNCEPISISSYAVRPKPVFKNAVVNSSIIMFKKSMERCKTLLTTQMYRRGENFNLQYLVDHLEFINSRQFVRIGRIAKISKQIELQILSKLFDATPIEDLLAHNGLPVYYRTVGGRYFKVVTNYTTYSNKESSFNVKSEWRDVVACALSSNLAFWFYQVYSNNLSWSTYDIFDFTIPVKKIMPKQKTHIEELYKRYVTDIEKNVNTRNVSAESKYTMDVFKEYKIVRSKSIIDEIDDYIGPLYGLTQEEIAFVKNYELEFRMAGE